MTILAAFGWLALPALGIAVMELDNWRRRRADRADFALINERQRASRAVAQRAGEC